MRPKLVIDIETKNTFADVGGKQNLERLDVSYVGLYSFSEDKFFGFRENELATLGPHLQESGLVIGFNTKHFDLPILNKYFHFNLNALPQFDLLEEVEKSFGSRISLDLLAKTNLGVEKSGWGLDAIRFYAEGDWESLEKYCLRDVEITRDLYNLVERQGYLSVPDKSTNKLIKVGIKTRDLAEENTLF